MSSQLSTLEPLEADERRVVLNVSASVDELVESFIAAAG